NTQLADAFAVTSDSGGALTVTFDCTRYNPATHTAVWTVRDSLADPGQNLKRGASYTVTLKGGTQEPVGINGLSRLVGDYVLTFRVTSTGIVLYTVPGDLNADVGADARICAVFTGELADPASQNGGRTPAQILSVSFVPDSTGRVVPVQGDAEFWLFDEQDATATPPGCPGPGPCRTSNPQTVAGNAVCFTPRNAAYDCFPVPTRLPYGHTFTARVDATVSDESGSMSWTFRTRAPPQLRTAAYGNDVLAGPAAECLRSGSTGCRQGPQGDGGPGVGSIPVEVPVNAHFTFEFSGPVRRASLAGNNLRLAPASGPALPVCSGTPTSNCLKAEFDQADARVTLTPVTAAGQPLLLAYDSAYALQLNGGFGGVTLASGDYLQNHVQYAFRTSPATTVAFGPPAGEDYYKTQSISVVFSRPIRFSTATDSNIVLWDNTRGFPMTVQVGLNAGAPRAAIVTPTPSYSSTTSAKIVVTRGVQDDRGNPLPPATTADPDVPNASFVEQHAVSGTTPSSSAISPSSVAAGNVTAPAAPCTAAAGEVCGNQVFTLTFGTNNGRSADRMFPATVNPTSVSLSATPATGCPGGNVPLEYRYRPGAVNTADSVTFFAADGYVFRSNCSYVLSVTPGNFGNVFTLAPASAPFTLTYRGDTAAPTLAATAIQGQQVGSASFVTLQGATGIRGDSVLAFAFNEEMNVSSFVAGNPATTPAANVVITNTSTNAIATGGSFALDPTDRRRVLYTPAQPLAGNAQYAVQVRGGTTGPADVAGNRLGANVSTASAFRVDNTAPTVSIGAFVNGPVPNQKSALLTFSEPMSAASLTTDRFDGSNSNAVAAAGTVRLRNTATSTYLATCLSLAQDGLTATVTTCDSWIPAGTPVELEVTGGTNGVKDRAGNALATTARAAGTL
ncbi:MAG: Ig-like domain-containing protein, partial [Myxococcales bacterium]